jgi:hypothetical protein
MMRMVITGTRTGRRDASPSGIIPPIALAPFLRARSSQFPVLRKTGLFDPEN